VNTLKQSIYAPFPLFLAAALFILMGPVFWVGVEAPGRARPTLVPENADLYCEIAPVMQYGFGRLRAGDFPLWNDRQLCGTPFFANPVHGLLQPLNLVFLFLDMPPALALHAFLALSLMGFFFVLFMRSLGVSYVAASLGGVVYVCCGATAAAMSRPALANVLAWMPLLCWALRVHLCRPRAATLIFSAMVLSLLLLSGSPVMALAATSFAFLYACVLILFDAPANRRENGASRRGRVAAFGGVALIGLVALGLTCIQWLPTVAWAVMLDAPRAYLGRLAPAGIMPQGVRALAAQLLQARSGALPAMAYAGVSTVLLLPAACFHPLPKWERCFWACAAAVLWIGAALYGAGATDGAWGALVYPAVFSTATLAALGADRLFAPRRNTLTPRLWGPLLLVLLVFVFVFILAPAPTRGRMLPMAAALVLFALFRTRWASALSGVALIVFLFVDLSTASVNYHGHPFFSDAADAPLSAEAAALIRDTALDDRVMINATPPNAAIHGNIGMKEGFRVAGGAGLPFTRGQALWWEALCGPNDAASPDAPARISYTPLLNVMAVRALAAAEGAEPAMDIGPGMRLRPLGARDGVAVFANETVVPRVNWVSAWRMALDLSAAIETLNSPAFDPRRECVILPDEAAARHLARAVPAIETSMTPDMTAVRIAISLDKPERLAVQVENATPGILVVSDTHSPGWRATVNGQRVPILKTNGLFRGVALPSGAHTVTFDYRPRPVIAGAIISISTIGIVIIALLFAGAHHYRR